MLIVQLTCQGDGDYELVKDVLFDDFLRSRIKKVQHFCLTDCLKNLYLCVCCWKQLLRSLGPRLLPHLFYTVFKTVNITMQSEAELLAEKKCVAHLTGEVRASSSS